TRSHEGTDHEHEKVDRSRRAALHLIGVGLLYRAVRDHGRAGTKAEHEAEDVGRQKYWEADKGSPTPSRASAPRHRRGPVYGGRYGRRHSPVTVHRRPSRAAPSRPY